MKVQIPVKTPSADENETLRTSGVVEAVNRAVEKCGISVVENVRNDEPHALVDEGQRVSREILEQVYGSSAVQKK